MAQHSSRYRQFKCAMGSRRLLRKALEGARPIFPRSCRVRRQASPRLATQALQDQLQAAWGDAIVTGTEDAFMLAISDADFHLMFKDLKSQA